MTSTLQDLLHAINIIGDDRDVTVDGIGSLAVVPPVKITPSGREYFKQALAANVIVEYNTNDCRCATYVCDDDEKSNAKAWQLLQSLAGYCFDDDFDKWFEGENAEMV